MSDDDLWSLKERADLLIELARQRDVIPLLLQALSIDPDDLSLLWSLAQAHYDLDDFEVALRYADRIVAIDPDWDSGHYWRSRALAKLNRLSEALEAAEEAARRLIEAAPEWFQAYLELAYVYHHQQLYRLSEVCCRKAVECDPDDPEPHNSLGEALNAQKRYEEAILCFERALQLDPKHVYAAGNLRWARTGGKGWKSWLAAGQILWSVADKL